LNVSRYSMPRFVILYTVESSRFSSRAKPLEAKNCSVFLALSTGRLAPYEALVNVHRGLLAIVRSRSA
jgi:hypothetical protein